MTVFLARLETVPKALNKVAGVRRGLDGDFSMYLSDLLQVFKFDDEIYGVAQQWRITEDLALDALSDLKERIFCKAWDVEQEAKNAQTRKEKAQIRGPNKYYWELYGRVNGFKLTYAQQIRLLHSLYKDSRVSVKGIGVLLGTNEGTARTLLQGAGVKLKKYKRRPLPPWVELHNRGNTTNTAPPSPAPLPPGELPPLDQMFLHLCQELVQETPFKNFLLAALCQQLECDIFRASAFLNGLAALPEQHNFGAQLKALIDSTTTERS